MPKLNDDALESADVRTASYARPIRSPFLGGNQHGVIWSMFFWGIPPVLILVAAFIDNVARTRMLMHSIQRNTSPSDEQS